MRAAAQPVGGPDGADTGAEPPAGVAVSPFAFYGTSRLYGQLANRQGSYQQTPDDFARMELSPTLSFYNVPFTLSMLFSTEGSAYRQNINSVSLDLDYQKLEGALLQRAYDRLGDLDELRYLSETMGGVERLRDSLEGIGADGMRDLDRLREYTTLEGLQDKAVSESIKKLDELGLVASGEKFFADFPALGVGVTYPRYSELTLSSVPVTGLNIEWNPGLFYIAVAGGKTQRAIRAPGVIDSLVFNEAYSRNLYAGRVGFGKKDGGHVILTGMYARDDAGSLPFDSSGVAGTPMANYVLGLDVNVPVVENYLTILGEVAGSVLTGDISAAELQNNDVPDWVRRLVAPNISSLVDYAFMVKAVSRIPESDTRLTASIRQVGPVFFSLGAPILRHDNLRWEARVEQRLLRRQITASAYYKNDADDIYRLLKTANTSVTSFGLGLGLNFARLPFLRVEYAPYRQRYSNLADQSDIENRTTLLSAITGYYYKVLAMNAGTSISFSSQQSNSHQGLSDYGVSSITANQSLNFRVPLGFSFAYTHSRLNVGDSAEQVNALDFSGSYTAFDIWSSALGLTVAKHGDDRNTGFYLSSSVGLWNTGVFEIRAEKNVFKSYTLTASDFDEFVLMATFTSNW